MEWTDLDQAYLEIFGTHPDVGIICPPVIERFVESLAPPAPHRPADEDAADSGKVSHDE